MRRCQIKREIVRRTIMRSLAQSCHTGLVFARRAVEVKPSFAGSRGQAAQVLLKLKPALWIHDLPPSCWIRERYLHNFGSGHGLRLAGSTRILLSFRLLRRVVAPSCGSARSWRLGRVASSSDPTRDRPTGPPLPTSIIIELPKGLAWDDTWIFPEL